MWDDVDVSVALTEPPPTAAEIAEPEEAVVEGTWDYGFVPDLTNYNAIEPIVNISISS